jgi:hypothetical protein
MRRGQCTVYWYDSVEQHWCERIRGHSGQHWRFKDRAIVLWGGWPPLFMSENTA